LTEFIDLYFKNTGNTVKPEDILKDLEKTIKSFSDHHNNAEIYKKAKE